MSNGDMPAIPLTKMPMYPEHNGLTKRELFAAMAMQGLAASNKDDWGIETPKALAYAAIDCANALLAALGDTND